MPALVRVSLTPAGTVGRDGETSLLGLGPQLAEWPELGLVLEVPKGMPAAAMEAARARIRQILAVAALPIVEASVVPDGGAVVVRVAAPGPGRQEH